MTPAEIAAIRAAAKAAAAGDWRLDYVNQEWADKTNPATVLRLLDRIEALERAVTVRWEGRNAYLGNKKIGCVSVLLGDPPQYMASSRLRFSSLNGAFPADAEARAALETAVAHALGLAEKGDNNARQRN